MYKSSDCTSAVSEEKHVAVFMVLGRGGCTEEGELFIFSRKEIRTHHDWHGVHITAGHHNIDQTVGAYDEHKCMPSTVVNHFSACCAGKWFISQSFVNILIKLSEMLQHNSYCVNDGCYFSKPYGQGSPWTYPPHPHPKPQCECWVSIHTAVFLLGFFFLL